MTTVGGMLNVFLTSANSPEREGGLWVPDKADVDAISEPLAGFASRRAPEGVDNPDATDVARLVMALGAYVGKQLRRRMELRGMPGPEQYMDDFAPADPDRFPPTTPDPPDPDAPQDQETRGFLGRRFGGQTAPTSPTDLAGYDAGGQPSESESTA